MALPPPPTSSEATPQAVIPPFEPDPETQANQFLASSGVFVLTARWGIRRWIPTSQRGASWLIVLVPLCVAIWGILA